jgi:hypothetical protein
MKPFWKGFQTKEASDVNFKRHVIVLYWDDSNKDALSIIGKARLKHPTIKVKTIHGMKSTGSAHNIKEFPTILLLKDGREKSRLTGNETKSQTLISRLFQEAGT